MATANLITGQLFGKLTTLSEPHRRLSDKRLMVRCRCACGAETVVLVHSLRSGHTKSCGCTRRESVIRAGHANKIHGATHGLAWKTYYAMLDRCLKPENPGFKRYGGRGIVVCDRWKDSFLNFLQDMGPRPAGLTLERINNDEGYSPENCRWATYAEQANNRSSSQLIEALGETLTRSQWAKRTGIQAQTIAYRIKAGWSAEKALTVSPQNTKP
jgi:hypothetical protein